MNRNKLEILIIKIQHVKYGEGILVARITDKKLVKELE